MPTPARPHFEVSAIVEKIDVELTEVFRTAAQANTRVSELTTAGQFVTHTGVEVNTDYVITVTKRAGNKGADS